MDAPQLGTPFLLIVQLLSQAQAHLILFFFLQALFPSGFRRIFYGLFPLFFFPVLFFPFRLFPAFPRNLPGPRLCPLPRCQLMLMQELCTPDQINRNHQWHEQERPHYPEIFVFHPNAVTVQEDHPRHQTANYQRNHIGQAVRHPLNVYGTSNFTIPASMSI